MTIPTVAIYIRLSLEDDDISLDKLESESISNQRHLLTDYIRNSPELGQAEILEFCDDGYSGKNFDRPGVQALLEAARDGRIHCMVVKDISRFGRDYITVGNYITRVFPFLGVRFIAVNDRFDSNRRGDIDSLDTSFKTLIYDMYSRDLSRKVKSAKYQLARRGVYINPVAPYGYRKAEDDRHKLIPDPAAAPVVQRIFELVAGGCSTTQVARMLNSEHIPTPSTVKEGTTSEHANWSDNYWRATTVNGIIRDRQYVGSTVFGKRVRNQVGVRRQVKTPLDDWIVVDDRHEPLVSKGLFQRAQEQLGGEIKQQTHSRKSNPLSKKVYCGTCGYAIVRKGKAQRYYRCDTPATVPYLNCTDQIIYEADILNIVVTAIRAQARHAVACSRLFESRRKQMDERIAALQKEAELLERLRQEIRRQGEALYENLVDGKLSREEYAAHKAALLKRREEGNQAEAAAKEQIATLKLSRSEFVDKYSGLSDLEELSAELAADLLNRVTVWPDNRIEVSLNYLDEITSVEMTGGQYESDSSEAHSSGMLLPGGDKNAR